MKSVLTYLFLVGLPVCGVLLILRAGQSLKAPSAVSGDWAVEVLAPVGCAADGLGSELTIVQSGPNLNLSLNSNPPILLSGAIDEAAQVTASQTQGASQLTAPQVYLEATLDSQTKPDRLLGKITLAGCPADLQFTATRRPASTSEIN